MSMYKLDIGIKIDLQRLIETRLLIQAGSGGGKSGAIRRLLEEASGKVQIIALDIEGELPTIREKYDFVLVAKDGDIPLNIKYAEFLAHKLLETNMSAVIDLYELSHDHRTLFVKRFLEALINSPKELWHNCLVVIDEAHLFCSESNKEESKLAVIDLLTRGRKRGFCGVLATQRISKLHKDAAAECYNKLIGKTGLDIDQKRAADELGLNTRGKEYVTQLRNLKRQEFYAFGAAISDEVKFFKVSDCLTKFPERGKIATIPPTPAAIKKILSNLPPISEEAETELKTKAELEKKVKEQTIEIRKLKAGTISNEKITEIKQQASAESEKVLQTKVNAIKAEIEKQYKSFIDERDKEIKRLNGIILNASKALGSDFKPVEFAKPDIKYSHNIPVNNISHRVIPAKKETFSRVESSVNSAVSGGEKVILTVIAQYPDGVDLEQITVLTGYKSTSRYEYLRKLTNAGYCEKSGGKVVVTHAGLDALGNDFEPLPTGYELQQYWLNKLSGGELKLFQAILEAHPNFVTKQELMELTGYKGTSTYEYLRLLSNRKLIKQINGGGGYIASENLF